MSCALKRCSAHLAYMMHRIPTKRIPGVIFAVLAAALVAGLVLPAWPPCEYKQQELSVCLLCGLKRATVTTGELDPDTHAPATSRSAETLIATPLSLWCQEHFGSGCDHEWRDADTQFTRYSSIFGRRWVSSRETGCRPLPSLISLCPDDRATLDALYRTSIERCKAFVSARLRGREGSLAGTPDTPAATDDGPGRR